MNKITLYHGTPDKIVVPTFGKGEKKHDYGRGFYLTESIDQTAMFINMNLKQKDLKFWIFKKKAFLRGLQN